MRVLLKTALLGLMLAIQTASAQTTETLSTESESPRLNLNLPRSSWLPAQSNQSAKTDPAHAERPQILPYGSGYESRRSKNVGTGQQSPMVNTRRSGRGR